MKLTTSHLPIHLIVYVSLATFSLFCGLFGADTKIRTGPMSWDIAPDGKRFLIICGALLSGRDSELANGTDKMNTIRAAEGRLQFAAN